jgi:hypothetical protein
MAASVTERPSKFTRLEDEKLCSLVRQCGEVDWAQIAASIEGRSARQCRERYRNYLSSEVTNAPWTEEDDQLLRLKFYELGPKWREISQFFHGRTNVNVKNRWASLVMRDGRAQGPAALAAPARRDPQPRLPLTIPLSSVDLPPMPFVRPPVQPEPMDLAYVNLPDDRDIEFS